MEIIVCGEIYGYVGMVKNNIITWKYKVWLCGEEIKELWYDMNSWWCENYDMIWIHDDVRIMYIVKLNGVWEYIYLWTWCTKVIKVDSGSWYK